MKNVKWTIGAVSAALIALILDILLRGPLTHAISLIADHRLVSILLLLAAILVLGIIAIGWWLLRQLRIIIAEEVIPSEQVFFRLESELSVSRDLLVIYDAMLVNLSELWRSHGSPENAKKLLRFLISECQKFLGNTITRVYILLPDGDYLAPYILEGIPEAHGYERKFYIGTNHNQRRGLAGAAFVNNEITKDSFKGSDQRYVSAAGFKHEAFVALGDLDRPLQYRSVIAVPIRDVKDYRAVGVMCLDSSRVDAFESEELGDFLMSIGTLVAMTLNYSDEIRRIWEQRSVDR